MADSETDRELKFWLVELGQTDREAYREIRSLLWDLFVVEKRRQLETHSKKKSDCC